MEWKYVSEIHVYSLNYNQLSIYTSLEIRAIFVISILASAQNFPREIKQFHSCLFRSL